MKTQEKKRLLSKLFVLYIKLGYSIETYMGWPLTKFDFEKVELRIIGLEKELEEDIMYDKESGYIKL
jgi:hypothetical protein